MIAQVGRDGGDHVVDAIDLLAQAEPGARKALPAFIHQRDHALGVGFPPLPEDIIQTRGMVRAQQLAVALQELCMRAGPMGMSFHAEITSASASSVRFWRSRTWASSRTPRGLGGP